MFTEQLKEENEKLRKEIEKLKKENEILRRELEKIRREFEEYKMRHPETVGVRHGKFYAIKTEKVSVMPKKPGAKNGHKAHFRPMPTQIDDIRYVPVLVCPECGQDDLSDRVQETRERTIEGIVIPKPIVTKYIIERRYCRNCKKIVETPVTDALPGARISLGTMLVIVWLKVKLRLTEEAIPQLLWNLFRFKISEGEVIHTLSQMADAFGPYYEQLLQEIRKAPARYIDETSWRINGMNAWIWAFVTKGVALYKIASSRTHKVPLKVLGKSHNGVDVHDRFNVYKTLSKKTKNPQQDCWAHILADSKELSQFYGSDGNHIHQVLKMIYARATAFNHKGTDADIKKLFHDMANELNRPYKSLHCYKFVVNLLKERDRLFEFVKNPDVDATNNIVERHLRHPVVARKISGGSRTLRGANVYEKLLSVIHTLQARGQDILTHGLNILLTSHG